jgi:alpha-L-rhamnosidase
VPAGTTATVFIPSAAPATVTEGGRPAAQSAGVRSAGTEKGKAVYTLSSGRYAFVSKLPR